MIPIGNGIQLVWIMMLRHDQRKTSALHSTLSYTVHEWKAFYLEEEDIQINHFRSRTVKEEHTILVCIIFTNCIYVFVKGFTSSLVVFTCLSILSSVI